MKKNTFVFTVLVFVLTAAFSSVVYASDKVGLLCSDSRCADIICNENITVSDLNAYDESRIFLSRVEFLSTQDSSVRMLASDEIAAELKLLLLENGVCENIYDIDEIVQTFIDTGIMPTSILCLVAHSEIRYFIRVHGTNNCNHKTGNCSESLLVYGMLCTRCPYQRELPPVWGFACRP